MKWFVLAATLVYWGSAHGAEFDHTHSQLDHVLRTRVKHGRVDYAWLKSNPQRLDAWLESAAAVSERDFRRWPEAQQLAFLINLYNGATLRMVADRYPLKSIKDIGTFFKGPWKQEVVPWFGRKVTLEYLEHRVLRKHFTEPRIHFALVCAANGCPPLRSEAFVAERLSDQLEEQGRAFLGSKEKNRWDPTGRILYLSPIFKWFDDDFKRPSGNVVEFVTPYFAPAEQAQIRSKRPVTVRYTEYNWTLNSQRAP